MIIKKLKLKNIRSYLEQEINFPPGSTLLAGDIGSGKTSVLLGIEFALFGLQPGQKGASLLRNDADSGSVTLELEIDDSLVVIERGLKRGKSISQEEAFITVNGERRELSVTELKNLVLSLLEYPGEFAKKTNLLYRFTVYTPQEQMKQIIEESPEERLNTLRHIFGIDKYKRIQENAELVRIFLREKIKEKQGEILDLENKKSKRLGKLEDIERLNSSILILEKEFLESVSKRKTAENSLQEIRGKIDEKKKLENEVEKTRALLAGKKEQLNSLAREEEKLKLQILETSSLKVDELELANLDSDVSSIKKQTAELNTLYLEVSSQITSLNLKNLENESQKSKISRIDQCPTCLQTVDSSYKANIINKFDSDISLNKKRILELTGEKSQVTKKIDELRVSQSQKESRISELKLLKIKIESFKDKQTRLDEIIKSKVSLEKDSDLLNQHVDSLKSLIFEFSKYDSIFQAKDLELKEAFRKEKLAEITLERTKKELELSKKEVSELELEISKKEEAKKALVYIMSLQEWLSSSFLELVSFTEKNVLAKLREEFSKLFNEWFNILVPEIFSVHLDEDFTPVIEQQDYELDYSFLSGGERTAIALAYRLALNQTINSLLSKIKTREIVILDEPTDGFSEQQLDKMRDVLSQLKAKQLILVSHEAKIESFVENIIKFKKESGITKVEV